ncbi:MAG: hypothetical protein JXD21_06345 [Candidatus Omnitrophica bacterium]|nr:hypothetical protein [Candidatus Omnitrophota bacterium]
MAELKFSDKEIREGAGLGALSYIFFLWILVFLFQKDNKFAHYHARQGLVIFVGEVIFAFLAVLFGSLFSKLGMLLFFILSLVGIYNALTGKPVKIPLVSDIAAKLVI